MIPVRVPFFAPKRLPNFKRSIKPVDIPRSTRPLLSIIQTVINNRARNLRRVEPHQRSNGPIQNWWNLAQHRRATRWSLYRHLIRHAQRFDRLQLDHRPAHQRKPNPRHPISTPFASTLVLTKWIRSHFKRFRRLRTISRTQELLRRAYQILNQLVKADAGSRHDLVELEDRRNQLIETRHRKTWAKVYRSLLAARRPPTPIMTGRFLRPTILNGPLPRLAHQPLHISMMISSRRKARERRMVEHRQLKDKLELIQQEYPFERIMIDQTDNVEAYDQEQKREVSSIMDRLKVINQSFALEKERESKTYDRELLDKIEAARRRRPRVMEERNRWKRMKIRLAEVDLATDDDPDQEAEPPEGKRFRIPDRTYWER